MDNKYINTFYEETSELLTQLESIVLDLGNSPDSEDKLNEVLRILHTIKGTATMFACDRLAAITHELETAFIIARSKKIEVSSKLLNLTLKFSDFMRSLLSESPDDEAKLAKREASLKKSLSALLPAGDFSGDAVASNQSNSSFKAKENAKHAADVEATLRDYEESENDSGMPNSSSQGRLQILQISFSPHADFYFSGNDPVNILRELQQLGETEITTILDAVPELGNFDPHKCYFAFEVYLNSACDSNTILDAFIFVQDICDLTIVGPEGLIQVAEGRVTADKSKSSNSGANVAASILKSANSVIESSGRAPDSSMHQQISVDTVKVESLVNLLGELVTVQARLSQTADTRADAELTTLARELETLTSQLREKALKISMLPVATIFTAVREFAQDFANQRGAAINLELEGGDTEFDKSILDHLFVPLSQLIKSCLLHSVEQVTERLESGLSVEAFMRIKAWQASGNAYIELRDDGNFNESENTDCPWHPVFLKKCLDDDQLEIEPSATLTEIEADSIRNYREVLRSLRGNLTYSKNDSGGLTYLLRLPLNLSIIEGLMVRLDGGLFLLPLSIVEECIELTEADQKKSYDKNVIMVRGQLVPYIKLREIFELEGDPPAIQQVVITMVDNYRIGFVVDKVIGEYQTVIRSWGRFCGDVSGIAGASIIGDGSIALIIDVRQLLTEEKQEITDRTEQ